MWSSANRSHLIFLELVAECEFSKSLVTSTYTLEGDGALIFVLHKHIQRSQINFSDGPGLETNRQVKKALLAYNQWAVLPEAQAEARAAEAQLAAASQELADTAAAANIAIAALAQAKPLPEGNAAAPAKRQKHKGADAEDRARRKEEADAKEKKAADAAKTNAMNNMEKKAAAQQKRDAQVKKAADAAAKAPMQPAKLIEYLNAAFEPCTKQFAKYYGTTQGHDNAVFKDMVDISKAATVFSPLEVSCLSRDEALRRVELLRAHRQAIDTDTIIGLQDELTKYRELIAGGACDAVIAEGPPGEGAPAEGEEPDDETVCAATLTFFKRYEKKIPTFAKVAKVLAAIPTSSAAAERVFSLLRRMFDDTQTRTFEDMLELALMLKYNNRRV